MKRFFLLSFISLLISRFYAQDLISGELTYQWISGNKYAIKMNLYKKTNASDNDTIFISFGDGESDTIISYCISYPNDLSVCSYNTEHTFPGQGTYIISYLDSFRIPNIQNIQNSGNEVFYLESELRITPFGGVNNSSTSSSFLVDTAYNGLNYQYNLNCSDPDGDSLLFSLVQIPSAYIPANININSSSGLFSWNNPDTLGNYIFAILTEEFRNGSKIGSTLREIMIPLISPNAIDKIDNENIISVYPNPASETISISFLPRTVNIFYKICDITGRELERNNIIIPNQSISLKNYNNGIYFLKISMDDKIFTKKFVKL